MGGDSKDMAFRLRKIVFDEWRLKRLTWQEVKTRYGFSKAWFYKFRSRFLRDGDDGLKDRIRKAPILARYLAWGQKIEILNYVYDHPTHGPKRIAMHMPFQISANAVWAYLVRENLNTRRKRRLWAESQGKPVLTEKERLQMSARKNHIESKEPGELVGIDTFVVCVKGLGKLCQYTACDTYSSYGWAKVYDARTSDNAVDFFVHHIFNTTPSLQDQACYNRPGR